MQLATKLMCEVITILLALYVAYGEFLSVLQHTAQPAQVDSGRFSSHPRIRIETAAVGWLQK